MCFVFFFSSRRRHTRYIGDWSSDVCSSDLVSESEILEKLGAAVKELDPDVLLTDNGDAFIMPYLARKAAEHKVPLQLGRDPDRVVERRRGGTLHADEKLVRPRRAARAVPVAGQ